MERRKLLRGSPHASLLLAAMTVAASPAAAGPHPVFLIPLVGARGGANLEADAPGVPPAKAGASVSFGLAVDVFVKPDGWFEAFLDHQTLAFNSDPGAFGRTSFDMAVDYLQFGGGYQPQEGRVRPFVTAALGLTRYGANPGQVGSAIGASGSLGGGFDVPIGQRLSFRFEARGYATIGDAAVSVTCGPGCFVQFGANGWYQVAARVGLAVRL
jgi:hypothetical protein